MTKDSNMLRKATLTLAAAAAVALGAPAAANAAVTFDSVTGSGFVGKGDVQIAFGWNNSTLQKNASGLSFTSSQDASQALSQSATQDGTMAVTQSVSQEVSCTVQTGNGSKKKTFYRDGEREGLRTGTREGERTGSRTGTLAGTILSSIAYDARVKNQITGFNLKGFSGASTFTATGSNELGAWEFGSYAWDDAVMGATEWGGWQSDPGENPAECLGNNPHIVEGSLSNEVTESAIKDGAITDDAIAEGAIVYGAVTASGEARLYVSYGGVAVYLPVTPVV